MLNCRVQRESQYIRKNCISVTAEAEYTSALGRNTVQMEIPDFSHESQLADKRTFIEDVRQEAKTSLKCFNKEKWTIHVKGLVQQGHFLDLASAQHEDILWKTHMFD